MADILNLPPEDRAPGDGHYVHQQRFAVDYDYPVHFTRGVFNPDSTLLLDVLDRLNEQRRHRMFVCVDEGVAAAHPNLIRAIKHYCHEHLDRVELVASPECVQGGEGIKGNWRVVEELMVGFGNQHLDRQSYVLAIGGGAVLDMVGFVAALVHRGLRLIRMPTTVLAQNDAGVGVKNGMNEHGMKNFLGTFAPPFAVINDFAFLETLPDAHWLGGISEAFKVAIIKDRDFLEFLCANARALGKRDQAAMEELVRRCAILHLDHIAKNGDPFELGTARPLDFGHWSAHKLETLSDFRVPHGQAVAAGIALDSYYAMKKGLIKKADLDRILTGITATGLPVWYPEMGERDGDGELRVLTGLEEFREHLGGCLTVTLPDGIGQKCEVHHVDVSLVEEGLFYLRDLSGATQAEGQNSAG